jgi:hypothetical protein
MKDLLLFCISSRIITRNSNLVDYIITIILTCCISYPILSIECASASAMGRKNDNLRMQMQLDLDETEACHFENMANGLLEKIGRITEERDGLQILFEQVQREREGLLASIDELKMESQIKDEEVQRASDLLDDMQDKIAERDLIIQRIKVSVRIIMPCHHIVACPQVSPVS